MIGSADCVLKPQAQAMPSLPRYWRNFKLPCTNEQPECVRRHYGRPCGRWPGEPTNWLRTSRPNKTRRNTPHSSKNSTICWKVTGRSRSRAPAPLDTSSQISDTTDSAIVFHMSRASCLFLTFLLTVFSPAFAREKYQRPGPIHLTHDLCASLRWKKRSARSS
jgi:hypothetical protein